jgi:uncharacterized protein YyaL (SSP411 family)
LTVETTKPGAARRANRLIESTSPYLLQHAYNPVNWRPWDAAALAEARDTDRPIFLSIGYAACHWCHVMERECFENQAIADLMNRDFVSIKVDREERPDLDDVYMLATQMVTGQGGWPMSVWLTPDLKPFYAGTYFPPHDSHGRPGFPRVLQSIAEAWRTQRDDLLGHAEKIAAAVVHHSARPAAAEPVEIELRALLARTVDASLDRFDATFGGFGGAPKFPPSQLLLLFVSVLDAARKNPSLRPPLLDEQRLAAVRTMTFKTLDGMARGGLFDQVAGGFARYSTDPYWLIPHFEKMLYDNGQLAAVCALAARALEHPPFGVVAQRTIDFWQREMTHPRGGAFATLDADSEGHEGKFYAWTLDELHEALPLPADAALIQEHFGMTAAGNFEGRNVLFVDVEIPELARRHELPPAVMEQRIEGLLETLRIVRAQRVPPALDDKILTGWNGLMISALALAGVQRIGDGYLEAAHRAVAFILMHHVQKGVLFRVSRNASVHTPGFLEDYALFLNGLTDLIDSTQATSFAGAMARQRACKMADQLISRFSTESGAFSFTGPDHDRLFAAPAPGTDNALPSANAVAIRALYRLSRICGVKRYEEVADRALQAYAADLATHPEHHATLLLALLENAVAKEALAGPHAAVTAAHVSPIDRPVLPAPLKIEPIGGDGLSVDLALASTAGERHGTITFTATLNIPGGVHIQGKALREKEDFTTVVRVRSEVLEDQQWTYPPPETWDEMGTQLHGYRGTAVFRGQATIRGDAPLGEHVVRVVVLAQPCRKTACDLPQRIAAEATLQIR